MIDFLLLLSEVNGRTFRRVTLRGGEGTSFWALTGALALPCYVSLEPARYRLQIDAEVGHRFPGYAAFLVYAFDVSNGPSDEMSVGQLRAAEETQRRALEGRKASDHPHVRAWRLRRVAGLQPVCSV